MTCSGSVFGVLPRDVCTKRVSASPIHNALHLGAGGGSIIGWNPGWARCCKSIGVVATRKVSPVSETQHNQPTHTYPPLRNNQTAPTAVRRRLYHKSTPSSWYHPKPCPTSPLARIGLGSLRRYHLFLPPEQAGNQAATLEPTREQVCSSLDGGSAPS